jgi:5-methylcytosine-specific restriction protein A
VKFVHSFNLFLSVVREKSKSIRRSSVWDMVREAHLDENPTCAGCGGADKLQVHHVIPVHLDPSSELDHSNLITLCMGINECHLSLGHKGSWRRHNPFVRTDCLTLREKRSVQSTSGK